MEFNCDHNDFPGAGNNVAYWKSITSFLSQHEITPPAKSKSRRVHF